MLKTKNLMLLCPTFVLSPTPPSGPGRYGGALPLSPGCTWVFCTSPSRRVIQSNPQDDHQHHGQSRMAAGTDDLLPQGRRVQSCDCLFTQIVAASIQKHHPASCETKSKRGEESGTCDEAFFGLFIINLSTAYL